MIKKLNNIFSHNKRLKIGVLLILFILLFYINIWIKDYKNSLISENISANKYLEQMYIISKQLYWEDRYIEAKNIYDKLTEKMWEAKTVGLAQALFQDSLDRQIKTSGIKHGSLSIEPILKPIISNNVWEIRAILTATFDSKSFYNFILFLYQNEKLIIIDELDVQIGRQSKFSIKLIAIFNIEIDNEAL